MIYFSVKAGDKMKYRIYELSAKALMNYVRKDEKKTAFRLTENDTK